MKQRLIAIALASLLAGLTSARADNWPAGAKVYFIAPANDAIVTGPVKVVMGLSGLGVAPAGVDKPNIGHHHILVDMAAPTGSALEEAMPMDDHLRHFGGGQTEATLNLAPGKHTLQLIMGDQNHIPHNPPLVSEQITIEVK